MSFGTDLNSAYFGELQSNFNFNDIGGGPVQEPLQTANPVKNDQLNSMNNQQAIQNNITMEEQVNVLKQELLKEKLKDKKGNVSLLTKFISKKREMIKIFVLSLIILLALSLNDIIKNYLKLYILESDLNSRKEFLVRFAYPLTIFVFIWIIKVFRSSD